jgi:tRNA threonylcarbamoyl adenosine modification protein YeaZ
MHLVSSTNDKKQKTENETAFVSIQSSYQELEIALYRNTTCIEKRAEKSIRASSQLIPLFDSLLKQNNYTLSDLSFLAIDQGPGAFTSLRVAISTANAIGFASRLPLIGIDGLDALAQQTIQHYASTFSNENPSLLVILLNAYSNDVYYAIYSVDTNRNLTLVQPKTNKKIDLVLKYLNQKYHKQPILFVGNGTVLHEKQIKKVFDKSIIPQPVLQVSSVDQIALMGLERWKKMETPCYKIQPLYLKTQTFAVRKN